MMATQNYPLKLPQLFNVTLHYNRAAQPGVQEVEGTCGEKFTCLPKLLKRQDPCLPSYFTNDLYE